MQVLGKPDISPEQGALSHNSTITIASVKYMLQFTLKAAEILGDSDPMLADVQRTETYPHIPL